MTNESGLWAAGILTGALLHAAHAPVALILLFTAAGMIAISADGL